MGWWEDLQKPPVPIVPEVQPANVPDAQGNYSFAGSIPSNIYNIEQGNHIPKSYTGGFDAWRNLDAIERMQLRKDAEGMKLGFHNNQPMTPEQQQAFGRVVADQYKPMAAGTDPNTLAYATPTRFGGSLSLPANYPNADMTHEGGHILDGIFSRKGKRFWNDNKSWHKVQGAKQGAVNPGDYTSSGRSSYDMSYDRPLESHKGAEDLNIEGNEYLSQYQDSHKPLEEMANTIWWRTHNPEELQQKNPKMNDYLNQQIKAQPGLWEVLSKGQKPGIWGQGPTMA